MNLVVGMKERVGHQQGTDTGLLVGNISQRTKMPANAAIKETPEEIAAVSAWYWAWYNKIKLQSSTYALKGHEWQIKPMESNHPNRVGRKAAQLGWSELEVLKSVHGLIHGQYPAGVLYLFPTGDDVSDFSKARFNPLIADNPRTIGKYVRSTDSTNIKRIGTGMLYLRGARLSTRVEGVKKDSSKLRSIPVDKVVFDERDLMESGAVDMAIERMSHSSIQEKVSFSTPTIPDYGIDKEYQASNQMVWMIKCRKCNGYTCLEVEFPNCISLDGLRLCKKCRQEIFSVDGEWVAKHPERTEIEGSWLSQLNSPYIKPKTILDLFNDTPEGNIQEVYNSKLGMAYIAAENKLTKNDVFARCGIEPMATSSPGPCAMGVDVGKILHVVIGGRLENDRYKILKMERVTNFNDVHDLAKRFNVECAIIDIEPETRTVREFQAAEPYEVWLCDYTDSHKTFFKWNEDTKTIMAYRTELCDTAHNLVSKEGKLEIPRMCDEVEVYAGEMANIAKVLEEDKETGARVYRYRKLGDDHYFHTTGYFTLACGRVQPLRDSYHVDHKPVVAVTDFDPQGRGERVEVR